MEKTGKSSFAANLNSLKKTKNYKGASGVTTINKKTGNREVVPVYILTVDNNGTYQVQK